MLNPIPFKDLTVKAYSLWDKDWLLLTAGDFSSNQYNTMTVSWGGLGSLWERPIVTVFVRPGRYTYRFMEEYDTFTLCAFPPQYHKALALLGAKSGRDGNKISESGLKPVASQHVAAPIFAEAKFALECRKIYWDDFAPEHFLDAKIHENYVEKDYHRIYIGEIVAAYESAPTIGTGSTYEAFSS
jgi:flavin reductase (DIM6/NTAB) family NADH-FMN oxidoreductase RutF